MRFAGDAVKRQTAASIEVNRNHRLRPAAQAAEEVAGNLHPAIFAAQQVLPVGRFRALADAGAGLHPGSAKVAAKAARRNPHLGIVANALDLAGVGRGINVEDAASVRRKIGARRGSRILREPYWSAHPHAGFAESFQVQVLGFGELPNRIRHGRRPLQELIASRAGLAQGLIWCIWPQPRYRSALESCP